MKELEPQLTPEDLDLIRETRRDFHVERAVPVEIIVQDVTGTNIHTDLPITAERTVTISGVVQALTDEDRLLRLGGRIRTGDLKLTLLHDEAIDLVGIEPLRGATVVHPPGGTGYLVDVVDVRGLGRSNRIELGLVLA